MAPSLILAVLASLACRVEDARYALRTAPQITARFRAVDSGPDWPGGVAFGVHLGASQRTYWFLPWQGGTDQLEHLASTTDVEAQGWTPPSPDGGPRPLGDLDYVAMDATYLVIDGPPTRGGVAPAHILLANLGDRLRHQAGARDDAPRQFFDLTACAPDPAARPR